MITKKNYDMPITKLTKSNIDRIPFTDKGQVLYHDDQLKGFVLRVGRQSKTYCVYHTVNGKGRQINIGRHGVFTPEQARMNAKDKLYLMAQGVDPEQKEQQSAIQNITLGELADEFLSTRINLKPKTRKDYRYYIDHYLPDWVDKPVVDITDKMFLQRYQHIGENIGHATANNVKRYTGSLFNYAIGAHELFIRNPVEIIKRTRSSYPSKRRTNIVSPKQLGAWWQAVDNLPNPDMTDYLKLVLMTGLRREEAARLKWCHVDFEERVLTIPETKNGEVLKIPMGDFIFDMLKGRYEYHYNEWVFPSSGDTGHLVEPKKAVFRVRNDSGIYFTIHDLRRTYMTIAASLAISTYALKRLVNHKTSHDVTGGYIILGIDQLREPVRKIENYILECVNGKSK